MNWRRNLRYSIHALRRSGSRTLLSAASVSVGIGAIVMLFGVSAAAERAFQNAIEEMGRNLLAISAQRSTIGALRGQARRLETLTFSDSLAIADEVDGVERVAVISLARLNLRYGNKFLNTTVIGTTPEFRHTNNQQLVAGRFFDDTELKDLAPVAVIGAEVVDELFGSEEALGERFLVGGRPFIVIGILREKGVDLTGVSQDDRILIPILTAQRRLSNVDYVDRIFVQTTSKEVLESTQAKIRDLLRDRHGIIEGAPDDFTIGDQNALLKALSDTDRTFSRLLSGLAAITIGLGSLGLLAISLLSVKERNGEIGLRLAVGARPSHVLLQFLSEACMIAGLGGLAGLLLGGTGIILGQQLIGWKMVLTWKAITYPFLISLGISVLFGAYPALRAAQLDPIVTLRAE